MQPDPGSVDDTICESGPKRSEVSETGKPVILIWAKPFLRCPGEMFLSLAPLFQNKGLDMSTYNIQDKLLAQGFPKGFKRQ